MLRFYLLSFLLCFTSGTVNKDLKIASGLDTVLPNSMAIGFYIQINNTGQDCQVECVPDRCCLQNEGAEDCDVLEIIGGCFESLPAGTSKTVGLAAPLLNPFERRGYCLVYLDSRPEGRGVFRNAVKIDFDTTLDKNPQPDIKSCEKIDEDPLNDCQPVDCDTYYNGHKAYFDTRLKRCVKVPLCSTNTAIYDFKSNSCIRNATLNKEDIEYIKAISTGHRPIKDILIIKNKTPRYNVSIFERLGKGDSRLAQNLAHASSKTSDKKKCSLGCLLANYFSTYKDALMMLAIVIAVQCFLICTMLYCMSKSCQCEKEKTLVSRFFNYRQDVSVTTPLIGTSDNDTGTTFQYVSESSTNIDKKIKCYKACHKDKPHNAKLSMSDDILSKCLTRRDWTRKPRSDAIPETRTEDWTESREKAKKSETKVYFENEVKKSRSDITPKAVKSLVRRKDDNVNVQPSSEQEIKCHNYNCDDGCLNYQAEVKTGSMSTEKGAQACFSNDSIDDFLSERGMIFLASENVSKYTISSSDSTFNLDMKQSYSDISGKTSKNNIVRKVLSLIRRKSRHCPTSDPGGTKKCQDNLNLELLHMSQASVFSSNASDSVDGLKKNKDSRSSL